MCIVLATTAHPSYALIVLDNRDEFILRPTSRPHWWTSPHQEVLSSRDLQRAERGTWLGITKTGNFAVLTNYRETDLDDVENPVQGTRSRGAMVNAWLTASNEESTKEFVQRFLGGEGVKGVGGFSLVCGKLRKRRDSSGELEPLAIISNRAISPEQVPWIAETRGEFYGLSNTSYDDPVTWPKVVLGKEKLLQVVEEAVEQSVEEVVLLQKLFAILDTDTLPRQDGEEFEKYIWHLRKSIFIPSIGEAATPQTLPKADQIATAIPLSAENPVLLGKAEKELQSEQRPDPASNGATSGVYGTQRQTILLVDWDGHVKFIERSLWDESGNTIERGAGDMTFEFDIEGWDGKCEQGEFRPAVMV